MTLKQYFGRQSPPPVIPFKKLRYGDLIFVHPNSEIMETDNAKSHEIGVFLGTTALGAAIFVEPSDWAQFQQGRMAGKRMGIFMFFETAPNHHGDIKVFVARKLGSFTDYLLPADGERLLPKKKAKKKATK